MKRSKSRVKHKGISEISSPVGNSLILARSLDKSGRREEAKQYYLRYLNCNPLNIDAWVELAGLQIILGKPEEASEAAQRALRIDGGHYGALVHAAYADTLLGNLDESEARFRLAIADAPERIAGRLMYSDCLVRKQRLEEARVLLDGILLQSPGNQMAMDRLCTLLVRLGDMSALYPNMQRQLSKLTGPEAEYAHGHLDLMFGYWAMGWERFEARLDIPGRQPIERGPRDKRWNGTPFPGETLLVTWEQGFGDTIMFLRYLPMVKALGGRVILEVQPPLKGITESSCGADRVVATGEPLPEYDLHVSLLSMPRIFKTTVDTVPQKNPYIVSSLEAPGAKDISNFMAAHSRDLKVGLCWAGNSNYNRDGKRSIPPEVLQPLSDIRGITWLNMQYESDKPAPFVGMRSMGSMISGFENTVHVLNSIDLLISVDTVLAHIAGALGVPTALLLSFIPDWRWMLGRVDTPWYVNHKLFRQPSPGNWSAVVAEIVHYLKRFKPMKAGYSSESR